MTEPANPGIVDRFRTRFRWFDRVMRAQERYRHSKGDFYAAGITYFTVFAIFPLLMVAFSIAGFVLAGQPDLLADVTDKIKSTVSGDLGRQLVGLMDSAIESRTSVGIIGLATAAWAGLGWMANLREALSQMWGTMRHDTAGFVRTKLRVTRALAKLADHDLVLVGEWKSRSRFDGFTLHREDERQAYLAPSASQSRSLPAAFFMAGWHLVLTSEEMATLLAVIEQSGQPRARRDAAQVGVALPLSVRWRFYGLAPEAFAARHELEEFGLIEMFDPMDRMNGKLSDKQRQEELRAPRITLKLDGFDFGRPAIEVVKAKLADPVPPRLVERAMGLRLLDNAGRWQEPKKP